MHDLIIIGGGPAAASAGVYAARKQLKSMVIADTFGGQSIVSPEIYNWIGTKAIAGEKLAKDLEEHLREYEGDMLTIKTGSKVNNVEKIDGGFKVSTEDGASAEAKAVLVAAGSHRRKLTVPGADIFDNKGLTYCATCDGPLFAGKDVVVVGGGNAGFETAAQLLAYCKSVTLMEHGDAYKADAVTVEAVLANENMTGMTNTDITEVMGENFVTGIKYKNNKTDEEGEMEVGGVFVEIGAVPSTEFVKNIVETTPWGAIVVDPRNQRATADGIWAAGDCTDGLYHQNNIAAGDAVKALEDIYIYLQTTK